MMMDDQCARAIIELNWIDKNLLLVVGSIRNGHLCVKNILPQDVGCGANGRVEGTLRYPSFWKICSSFGRVTRQESIYEHN